MISLFVMNSGTRGFLWVRNGLKVELLDVLLAFRRFKPRGTKGLINCDVGRSGIVPDLQNFRFLRLG